VDNLITNIRMHKPPKNLIGKKGMDGWGKRGNLQERVVENNIGIVRFELFKF
jgi:hypothetical protein